LSEVTSALLRYRVMAYTVGTLLLVLVAVGVPLQVWVHNNSVVSVVGPLHGILYIVYLIVAYDLARRARFTLLQLLAMIAAGLVPLLAFIVERWVAARVERELALALPRQSGLRRWLPW
jgi:integral membrane protein